MNGLMKLTVSILVRVPRHLVKYGLYTQVRQKQ